MHYAELTNLIFENKLVSRVRELSWKGSNLKCESERLYSCGGSQFIIIYNMIEQRTFLKCLISMTLQRMWLYFLYCS